MLKLCPLFCCSSEILSQASGLGCTLFAILMGEHTSGLVLVVNQISLEKYVCKYTLYFPEPCESNCSWENLVVVFCVYLILCQVLIFGAYNIVSHIRIWKSTRFWINLRFMSRAKCLTYVMHVGLSTYA